MSYGRLQLCDWFWIIFVNIVFQKIPKIKVWGFQIWWVWWPFRYTSSADQPMRKVMIQPLHVEVCCVMSCPISLKPLLFTLQPTRSTKSPPELTEHHNVTLLIDCYSEPIIILESKWSYDSMLWDRHAYRVLARDQRSPQHFIWHMPSPEDRVLAIDVTIEGEVYFVTEPDVIEKIWFNFNFVKPLAYLDTFLHVLWRESLFDLNPVWLENWKSIFRILFTDARESPTLAYVF